MHSTVLVVDDDASFRRLAARTLASYGYAVIAEAGTIAEALARMDEVPHEAVLVDVGLPDGDGFTLARRLVELPWSPRVVVVSSNSDGAQHSLARRVGAAGFVPKEDLPGDALRRLLSGA